MKNRIKIIGIALIIAGSFSSCKEKEDVASEASQPANSITAGKWKVSSFTLNGIDHTDFYKDYTFSFNSTGAVKVSGPTQLSGIWSTSNMNGVKNYYLYFGEIDPFNLLNNEEWIVVSQNDVTLEMDARRGDDGRETVSFSRQ